MSDVKALIAEARLMGTEDRAEVGVMLDRLADALEEVADDLEQAKMVLTAHATALPSLVAELQRLRPPVEQP